MKKSREGIIFFNQKDLMENRRKLLKDYNEKETDKPTIYFERNPLFKFIEENFEKTFVRLTLEKTTDKVLFSLEKLK